MADFSSIAMEYNKAAGPINTADTTPDWTGLALPPGGISGAGELRFAPTGGGQTTSTPSASWPLATKPPNGTGVWQELYAFRTNTDGSRVNTYDGSNTAARMLRLLFSGDGTPASAMQFSAFDSTSHTTPSPGTQPSLINGSTNTSNRSAVKINFYGSGAGPSGSVQHTPSAGSVGSAPTATSGTNGAVSPATTPAWLTNWQDAQGWTDYVLAAVTVQALFAFQWYWATAVFYASDISASTYLFVYTLQYTYS